MTRDEFVVVDGDDDGAVDTDATVDVDFACAVDIADVGDRNDYNFEDEVDYYNFDCCENIAVDYLCVFGCY